MTAMRAEGAWHGLGSPLRRVVGRFAPESNPDFVAYSKAPPVLFGVGRRKRRRVWTVFLKKGHLDDDP